MSGLVSGPARVPWSLWFARPERRLVAGLAIAFIAGYRLWSNRSEVEAYRERCVTAPGVVVEVKEKERRFRLGRYSYGQGGKVRVPAVRFADRQSVRHTFVSDADGPWETNAAVTVYYPPDAPRTASLANADHLAPGHFWFYAASGTMGLALAFSGIPGTLSACRRGQGSRRIGGAGDGKKD